LNGPILDLIAPIRPLQLCADGGYQLRFRGLEGTPNYGPRQIVHLSSLILVLPHLTLVVEHQHLFCFNKHTLSAGLSSLDTELSSYLDSDTLQKFDEDFNILNWWHEHKLSYPVLSILARDVIFVPVSTISLESAFSLCDRIIEER
jgi:hypothetical protein